MNNKQNIFFRIVVVFALLLYAVECKALNNTIAPAQEHLRINVSDNISKILHMESEDTITLHGVIYKIPSLWIGKRIQVEKYTFEDFGLIPQEYTWNNSQLYLLKEANNALITMIEKAKDDGITLIVHSAYRSESYQKSIFLKMMKEGRSFDDIIRYVAPPGYSEHMLGTVVDFNPSNWNFSSEMAYTWLLNNGASFGFHESYPHSGSQGAPWEPWHWRFMP